MVLPQRPAVRLSRLTAAGLVDLPGATGREGWEALAGSPDELADGLRDYARAGISPVVLWFAPVLELLDRG